MGTQIDLIVTDLDGTLWDHTRTIAPATHRALRELANNNIPVLAATARRSGSARVVLEANGAELLPAIVLDGAVGRDLRDGTIFHRSAFDRSTAADILATFLNCGLEPVMNIATEGEDDAVIGRLSSSHPDHLEFSAPFTRHQDLFDTTFEEDVVSFLLCGVPRAELDAVAEAVRPLAAATVSVDNQYGNHCLSVRPPGVDKWTGVEAFCAAQDLNSGAVLAIGDGENDLELIGRAAVGCAIEGGSTNAIEIADYVLGPASAGGWAEVLELLG